MGVGERRVGRLGVRRRVEGVELRIGIGVLEEGGEGGGGREAWRRSGQLLRP